MFPWSAMSEFKFACPVCGQRMAVDSSASGAQVECPTCFQIVIVPKAPAAGSKYQLSATQYIKPVILPPVTPASSTPPVVHQRKSAVLIFGLIFACAVTMALLVRERIVRTSLQKTIALTNAVPLAVSPLWTPDLTRAKFPKKAAVGTIHGQEFVCREAVLQNGLLVLRNGHGWQSEMAANVFVFTNAFSTNAAEILSGMSFEVDTNHAGFAPSVSLFWREGDLRVMEMFTNNFAMKLEFGKSSGGKLPGKIYLCLPDEAKSCVAGTFTAEIQRFPMRRSP
jgi:hypothetical protein